MIINFHFRKITERKKKKTEAEKLWDNMSLTEKEVFQSHTRRRRTTRLPIIQNFEETEEGCIVEVPIPLIDLDNDAVESVTGPQHENVTVSENVLSTESTDQEVTGELFNPIVFFEFFEKFKFFKFFGEQVKHFQPQLSACTPTFLAVESADFPDHKKM